MFQTQEAADVAVKEISGTDFNGSTIKVIFHTPDLKTDQDVADQAKGAQNKNQNAAAKSQLSAATGSAKDAVAMDTRPVASDGKAPGNAPGNTSSVGGDAKGGVAQGSGHVGSSGKAAEGQGKKATEPIKLHISNVHFNCTKDKMNEVFSKCGKLAFVDIMKGFAFLVSLLNPYNAEANFV